MNQFALKQKPIRLVEFQEYNGSYSAVKRCREYVDALRYACAISNAIYAPVVFTWSGNTHRVTGDYNSDINNCINHKVNRLVAHAHRQERQAMEKAREID